ncbi:MAG: Do family serine endopeptidase [Alphaproteobacteria bacterium]|nr:Do family serine endopeptidase [Alphaproteobacteria bacterium]MBV8549214.1 Do family serine endopeptidase [Alphaproteobacteria bacterium]
MKRFIIIACLLLLLPASLWAAEAVPASRNQITLSFAPLVKQVTPAVVNIYTQRVVEQRVSPLFADPFFRQFFEGATPPGMTRQRLESSLGSGVLVRADGLIVTSNHVIRGAEQIRVVLSDRREYDASVVLADEHADLAVLRIDAKGEKLPFLQLRDSDDAEVGDLVLAIGNPFGVGQTVTSGIISAMTHGAVGSSDLDYFIQTDAAINPGNSGGALVTMDGHLVGINTAIYSRDGGNMGIGFAVPSNVVRVVLNAVEGGKKTIIRPWIGVDGQAVTQDLAATLGMMQPSGVLVNKLLPESPAVKSGVQVGDVIQSVGGREVEDPEALHYRLATLSVGQTTEFGLLRKGQKVTVAVPLIAPPEVPPRNTTHVSGRNPLEGVTIENLSPAVVEARGLHAADNGVVVVEMKQNGIAANIGVQVGDVILAVNNVKTPLVEDVVKVLKTPPAAGQSWRVTIRRGDNTVTLLVGG